MTTAMRTTAIWAAPDARLILKASADGSPEWQATRRTCRATPVIRTNSQQKQGESQITSSRTTNSGITSTGATVLGGVNKRSNPYSLWASYFDEEEDDPSMADLYWYGHEVEPMLARRFQDRTGIGTRNVGTYAHREYGLAFSQYLAGDLSAIRCGLRPVGDLDAPAGDSVVVVRSDCRHSDGEAIFRFDHPRPDYSSPRFWFGVNRLEYWARNWRAIGADIDTSKRRDAVPDKCIETIPRV